MSGVLAARTRRVWQVVKEAGAATSLDDIRTALPNVDSMPLHNSLQTLVRGGWFAIVEGRTPRAWIVTDKPLPGEGASAATVTTPAPPPAERGGRPLPAAIRTVANSVFALGAMAASGADEQQIAATAAPTPAPQAHGFSAAAVMRESLKAVASTPAPSEAVTISIEGHTVGLPLVERQARAPRFELHSDGTFVIDAEADPGTAFALPPDVTRAMFRWLDRVGGLDLSRILEEERAS